MAVTSWWLRARCTSRIIGGWVDGACRRVVLQPAGCPGHRTEARYLSLAGDIEILERMFSLSNLQRAR